jgi:hypothetical protein
MRAALPVIERVFRQYAPAGFVVEYTAGQEWLGHAMWSAHHSGYACDIRTKTLPDGGLGVTSRLIADELRKALNPNDGHARYKVLLNDQGPSKPHIHVQCRGGPRVSAPGDWGDPRGPKVYVG